MIEAIFKEPFYSLFWVMDKKKFNIHYKAKSAYVYYAKKRLNLLTLRYEKFSFQSFLESLKDITIDRFFDDSKVIHFFYEAGYVIKNFNDLIDKYAHVPLVIELDYAKVKTLEHKNLLEYAKFKGFTIKPNFQFDYNDYKKSFKSIYAHLMKGDCYQVNYTKQFNYKINTSNPNEFISALWKKQKNISPYAHLTYLSGLNKIFFSNSPECLFQLRNIKGKKGSEIYTMPIKGSASIDGKGGVRKAKQYLKESVKEQSELNMITDLSRNDLASIDKPRACIISPRDFIQVPNIIHQHSIISQQLPDKTNLFKVISSLFPAGSITGAPKKKVMSIIEHLETVARGFYCGSTLLMYKNRKSCSINIRSGEVDLFDQKITCGSGGGITLLSHVESEYREIILKLNSLIKIFK